MREFKRWLIKNWINVLLFIFVICVAFISIRYAQRYTASAKTTNDIRSIWQLAITAIAASVGIGTIINSTRSASIAAESMRVTKGKESREQSAHFLISSEMNYFSISPPMYKNDTEYSMIKKMAKYLEINVPKGEFIFINEVESENYSRKSFLNASSDIRDNRIKTTDTINTLKILNIGKGVGVNIEYSFNFLNMNDFKDYSTLNKHREFSASSAMEYPPYDINVQNNDNLFLIEMVDSTILAYADKIGIGNVLKNHHSKITLVYEKHPNKNYIDYLKSSDETCIPIPNEFMVLSKHYAIIYFYKKLLNSKKLSKGEMLNLNHLLEVDAIKPVGRFEIQYYNEEEIRAKFEGDRKKEQLFFEIYLKDDSIYKQDDKLHFNLEVIPSKVV